MAKCIHCEYPYATNRKCPNCGSKNPNGGECFNVIILIIIGVVIYAIINSYHSKSSISGNLTKVEESNIFFTDSMNTMSNNMDSSAVNSIEENSDENSDVYSDEINNEAFPDHNNDSNLPLTLQRMIDDGGKYVAEPTEGVLYQSIYYYKDGRVYDPENNRYGSWLEEQ